MRTAILPNQRGRKDIYFAQVDGSNGLIKIGASNNVALRLRVLTRNTGRSFRLLGLIPNQNVVAESGVHRRWAHCRVQGLGLSTTEWFLPMSALVGYIAALPPSEAEELMPGERLLLPGGVS